MWKDDFGRIFLIPKLEGIYPISESGYSGDKYSGIASDIGFTRIDYSNLKTMNPPKKTIPCAKTCDKVHIPGIFEENFPSLFPAKAVSNQIRTTVKDHPPIKHDFDNFPTL